MKKLLFGTALFLVLGFGALLIFLPENNHANTGETIVYETEVESGDECSSYETFDATQNVCVFECASEAECEQILNDIDTELESWTESLTEGNRQFEEKPTPEDELVALYTVKPGEQISLAQGTESPEYRALWQDIAALSPNALSDTYIEQFGVYSDPNAETLAYVVDEDGNGQWLIAINTAAHATSEVREQKSTIIHELAHILTLNKNQVTPRSTSRCTTYETDEGCAGATSYLFAFVNSFWKNMQNPAFDPAQFVTEYAATNPEEDIAESFAFYVLERNHTTSNTRNQKVNFFNNYPELVSLRSEMRQVLARDIVRLRRNVYP